MIISRTPYRVSLFGGGTDYPQWYLKHGGSVIGMAIDKYCYISVRHLPPFFEHKHRVVYSLVEHVKSVGEIKHPSVRAVLTEMAETSGMEIHHDGDLPARSGIGSSSSFTVGLLNALYALRGRMTTKKQLAEEAIRIEQTVIGENVGSQDQIWAAYGGFNRIDFHPDGSFTVAPMIVPLARERDLVSHLMLFFTGQTRHASEIAGHKIANMSRREDHLLRLSAMVDEAQSILGALDRPIKDLGTLLHQSWLLKRELAAEVSTSAIDEIYQAGLEAGASGGKVIGAGGGGFIVFVVEPHKQQAVRERLHKLIQVEIDIDTDGSTIVVYEPNDFGKH